MEYTALRVERAAAIRIHLSKIFNSISIAGAIIRIGARGNLGLCFRIAGGLLNDTYHEDYRNFQFHHLHRIHCSTSDCMFLSGICPGSHVKDSSPVLYTSKAETNPVKLSSQITLARAFSFSDTTAEAICSSGLGEEGEDFTPGMTIVGSQRHSRLVNRLRNIPWKRNERRTYITNGFYG